MKRVSENRGVGGGDRQLFPCVSLSKNACLSSYPVSGHAVWKAMAVTMVTKRERKTEIRGKEKEERRKRGFLLS